MDPSDLEEATNTVEEEHDGQDLTEQDMQNARMEGERVLQEASIRSSTVAPQEFYQFNISELASSKTALRNGRFRFDDGVLREFIYVPQAYPFQSTEGFRGLLAAIGLTDMPEVVFEFPTNTGVVPNLSLRENHLYWDLRPRDYTGGVWRDRDDLKYPDRFGDDHSVYMQTQTIETRVRNVLNGVVEACSQTSAVFLITDGFKGNVFAEMACEAAASKKDSGDSVFSVGLFSSDEFSKINRLQPTDTRRFSRIVEGSGDKVPWDTVNDRLDSWDSRREKVPAEAFESSENVTTTGEIPKYAIDVDCQLTGSERSFLEAYRHQHLPGGLASKCEKILVFASNSQKEAFREVFCDLLPSAFLVVGSSEKELELATGCLKEGRPLFVLEHTGKTSNAVAGLVRFGKLLKSGKLKEEDVQRYLKFRLPESVDLWWQVGHSDKLWYDTRSMAYSFASLAPNFNPDAYEVFNLRESMDINQMQDKITKVMSSVFETVPELGGAEKDRDVMAQARQLVQILENAKNRYHQAATAFQIAIRVVILMTVILTVIQSETTEEDEDSYEALKLTNLILPLVGSILLTLDSAYRPSFKYAALLQAEKRIESEMYRFKTRTGVYRARGGGNLGSADNKRRARIVFSQNCQDIFGQCIQSDFKTGSLFGRSSVRHEKSLLFNLRPPTVKKGHHDDLPGIAEEPMNGDIYVPPSEKGTVTTNGASSDDDDERMDQELKYEEGGREFPTIFYSRHYKFKPTENYYKLEKEGCDFCDRLEADESATTGYNNAAIEIMKPKQYIDERLAKSGKLFYSQLPHLTMVKNLILLLTICLTAASTAFVSVDLSAWVPILLALAAAFEFAGKYMQLDTRVPNLNASAGELTKTLLWWNGLTLIQSRSPSKKDELVDRTEKAILLQYEHMAGSTIQFANDQAAAFETATSSEDDNKSENLGGGGSVTSGVTMPSFVGGK